VRRVELRPVHQRARVVHRDGVAGFHRFAFALHDIVDLELALRARRRRLGARERREGRPGVARRWMPRRHRGRGRHRHRCVRRDGLGTGRRGELRATPKNRGTRDEGEETNQTHREAKASIYRADVKRHDAFVARVLHIEDDPRNRLLVRKLLTAEGLEVVDAPDGLTGVRLALSHKPDLVLVDLNIPGLDGYEVTLRLRSEPTLVAVPIVAITAEGDRDTSAAVGCDGFVQKPIDARVFASQIRSFLKGHRPSFATSPDATGERLRLQSGRIVAHLEEKVAELSAANERLREVERLRGEFYRNISHELATPLTPIVGYLRMLIDEELGDVSKPQLKALRAMDDSVKRLRSTLDNLIDVTGLETGRMKFFHREYDFVDTVRRAMANVAEKFTERRITVLEQLPRNPAPAYGDADRLGRAIGQLLENAAKFTPEGGIVGVAVWRSDVGYAVTIADTGPGIPAEREAQIFEPFVQLDGSPTRAHGGVGVGLAIARRVARGLGGDVQLQPGGAVIANQELRGAAVVLSVAFRAEPLRSERPPARH